MNKQTQILLRKKLKASEIPNKARKKKDVTSNIANNSKVKWRTVIKTRKNENYKNLSDFAYLAT